MAKGGARSGSGRPKGAVNIKTKEAIAQAAATGITPLEFLMAAMRDESRGFDAQIDAAKAAAPYVHAKLAAVAVSGELGVTVSTKEQRDASTAAFIRANG